MCLLNFLHIWNTVIPIVLMCLSLIPISVSVSHLFQLVGFSPHSELYFPASLHDCKFLLKANVNFTLLGAGYFCILINVLELCSRMKLNYLETD